MLADCDTAIVYQMTRIRPIPARREDRPGRDSWLVRRARDVERWWPLSLAPIGGTVLALAHLFGGLEIPASVVGGFIVFASAALERRQLARLNAVNAERDRLRERATRTERAMRDLAGLELQLMAENRMLRYSSNERISLFAKVGDALELVGRHSANPNLKTAGRPSYPLNQGCVGRAWEDGLHAVTALPDPQRELNAWMRELAQLRIPEPTAEAMTMKSRTCVAVRIGATAPRNPLGVVVFESTDTAADALTIGGEKRCELDPDELKSFVDQREGERLRGILEVFCEARRLAASA